jgi:hypothetical protein
MRDLLSTHGWQDDVAPAAGPAARVCDARAATGAMPNGAQR